MAVTLAAAAVFFFYLANIPLKIALVFHTHPQAEIASGASVFEGRFALRRAMAHRKSRGFKMPASIKPALRAGKYLLRHIRLERFSARGVISLPDAAATALLCGLCSSIQSACLPFGHRVQINLQPDFSASGSEIELLGMIDVRLGHIILTALIFAFELSKERFGTWTTGIQLKALCRPRWKTSAT